MSEHESADKHFELAVALSRDALKALLLVNAGAAGALVALMDKTSNSKDYALAILLFGSGAVAAVVSYALGYFSQLNYANHKLDVALKRDGSHSYFKHNTFQILTLIFVAIALMFSITGMIAAYCITRF